MKQLWVATGNQGKLSEFKLLFSSSGLELHAQSELPVFSQPPENGESFAANARIKARALRSVRNTDWVIGEDSGLICDGLNGMPGIHSARYAGPKAADSENTAKLLKMLAMRSNNRAAHFVSTIVLFTPTGEEQVFEGRLSGEIARAAKGNAGFGYDNVFIPSGQTQTLAELGLAFKNKVSHRAMAVKAILEKITF